MAGKVTGGMPADEGGGGPLPAPTAAASPTHRLHRLRFLHQDRSNFAPWLTPPGTAMHVP
jgi:hypothetical protein